MSEILPPEVDLHVHTIASGHAFSTIEENARGRCRTRPQRDRHDRSWSIHARRAPSVPFHGARFYPRHPVRCAYFPRH